MRSWDSGDGRWYVVMVGNQKRYKRQKEWREGYNKRMNKRITKMSRYRRIEIMIRRIEINNYQGFRNIVYQYVLATRKILIKNR